MSYILDALRKSERERTRGSLGKLETPEQPTWEAGRTAILVLGTLLALLLVFAGTMAWIYGDSLRVLVTAVRDPAPEAPASVSASGAQDGLVVDSTIVLPGEAPPIPKPETGFAMAPVEPTEPSTESTPESTPAPESPPVSEIPGSAEPVDRSRLPGDVQATLPPLIVSVLSYSEDVERRFAMIDGRIYREGDWVSGDWRVEQITRDRILLSGLRGRFTISP
jgi:general secretion pathway protein B